MDEKQIEKQLKRTKMLLMVARFLMPFLALVSAYNFYKASYTWGVIQAALAVYMFKFMRDIKEEARKAAEKRK